jgi:hypothetical protein
MCRDDGSVLFVQFAFFGEKSEQEVVRIKIQLLLARIDICGFTADPTYLKEDVQPGISHMHM